MVYFKSEYHKLNAEKARLLAIEKKKQSRMERKAEYQKNPKLCLECHSQIPYEKKLEGKFCSRSCSGFYNGRKKGKHSLETAQKIKSAAIQLSLSQDPDKVVLNDKVGYVKKCMFMECNKPFFAVKRKTLCCSIKCGANLRASRITPEKREKMRAMGRKNLKKQAAEGKWKGWNGRGEPSFPEKYITSLLKNDGYIKDIDYKFNLPFCGFFIDFAFQDIKLALEVDGKQHDYPENKERDERKDEALVQNGWTVLRLKWHTVKKNCGKKKVHDQYQKILDIIKAQSSSP